MPSATSATGALSFRPALCTDPYTAPLHLEARGRGTAPRWLIKTGDISYSLYLVHISRCFLIVGKLLEPHRRQRALVQRTVVDRLHAPPRSPQRPSPPITFLEKPSLRLPRKSSATGCFKARSHKQKFRLTGLVIVVSATQPPAQAPAASSAGPVCGRRLFHQGGGAARNAALT